MFKTFTTFAKPFEDIMADESILEAGLFELINWLQVHAERNIDDEVVAPDRIFPDTFIRTWKNEDQLNSYLDKAKKIFNDVVTIEVIKGP